MDYHKKFSIKGTTNVLKLVAENQPESPREWDNLGICAFFHSHYSFGDKTDITSQDYANWKEVEKAIIKDFDGAVVLPVYMYDHSGVTISTEPFSCSWDSGQLGFIYTTKEKLREEYSVKRISKKVIEKARMVLKSEIGILDQYITGDVYGFVVEDENGNNIDSCWGFYGDDIKTNGVLDHVTYSIENLEEI